MTSLATHVLRLLAATLLPLLPGFGPCAPAAQAQAAPEPAAAIDYVRRPHMSAFSVAPSNRHAAFLLAAENGRVGLAVLDLENPLAPARLIAAYADADITRVAWINDRRLFYEAYQDGTRIEAGGGGTFAVDLDGGRVVQLVKWVHSPDETGSRLQSRVLPYHWKVWRPWDRRGDDLLVFSEVVTGDNDRGARLLGRLDSVSGHFSRVGFGLPPYASDWTFDAQGRMRLVGAIRDGRRKLYLRAEGSEQWVAVHDEPMLHGAPLLPVYIEADGGLIVLAKPERDTLALYTWDPHKRALGAEPLLAADGYDALDAVEIDHRAGQVVGAHLLAERLHSVWFAPALEAAQRLVDASLPPGRFNRLLCGDCLSAQRFVVRSGSDRVSAEYFVLDAQHKRLTRIGAEYPWLPESGQGRRSFQRVPARDGLSLPLVLTHPPGQEGARALPAVVLVHGGPWVRGATLEWSGEAQFLASRGYRVLEVDFRGSTGLGGRHFGAGIRQWGLAMQDDLVDALAWAVRENLVDPARVCIAGSSYGGYAALMGPVRHPGSWRCAASHAGVTDLMLMFGGGTTDVTLQGRKYTYPALIGDPVTDAEQLRQTSPLHRVAEIKVPLLLAQGQADRRVSPLHARRFVAAARAAGVDIEHVDYEGEAHGWYLPRNHADYLQRLERLLARSLAAPR